MRLEATLGSGFLELRMRSTAHCLTRKLPTQQRREQQRQQQLQHEQEEQEAERARMEES